MIDVKINCAQSTCKKDKSMKRIKCFLLSYSTSWTACFIGQNFQFSIKTKLESVASVDSPYNSVSFAYGGEEAQALKI